MPSSPASTSTPIRCGGPCCTPRPPRTSATEKQRRDLAAAIAAQAQAIADGQVAYQYAAVRRLVDNVDTLRAWTADDRT